MSLSPATSDRNVGDVFSVDIVLDTEGAAASGATAIISYDTAKLEVQDDATRTGSCATGVNIKAGTIMGQCIGNAVDTAVGEIRYDAGNLGASYTGRGVLATVRFKALSEGTAQASFVFDPNKTTDTSAVSAASGPTNLLTTVNDGTYTILAAGATPTTPLPATGVVEDTLMLLAGGFVLTGIALVLARKAFLFR